MLKIAVCVSGGGTNLQAIIDGIENQTITNTQIKVVISNNKNAYALERAKNHGIDAVAVSPKDFETRELHSMKISLQNWIPTTWIWLFWRVSLL